jgi:hypothetical protein
MLTLRRRRTTTESTETEPAPPEPAGCVPIGDVRWRHDVRVTGRVRSVRVQPRANVPTLECTLVDPTGGITVVFLGRRRVPGIGLGTWMTVEGRAGSHHGKLALLNPEYTLAGAERARS